MKINPANSIIDGAIFPASHVTDVFVPKFPNEITSHIFSFLEYNELLVCAVVSRTWNALAESWLKKTILSNLAFGRRLWTQCIGDTGAEPSLPRKINELLNRECHFWPGKKIRETHMLVLIPKTIEGNPVTVRYLNDSNLTSKDDRNPSVLVTTEISQIVDPITVDHSRWVLITKEIVPDTVEKDYDEQARQIQMAAEKTGLPYSIPSILEATTCIFSDLINPTDPNYYLFGGLGNYKFTRCESVNSYDLHIGFVCDGGFLLKKLHKTARCENTGVLALIRLDKI